MPRALTSALLAGVVMTCASGPRAEGSLRCERCTFAVALAEVVAAVADIDAQVAEARVDERAGSGELWALIDWRRPAADSAVVVVRLATDRSGATVSYSAVPLARLLEAHGAPTPIPNAPGPAIEACQPCRSWQVAIEAAPGDNLRALASQREATRLFAEALAGRLGVRGAGPPLSPAPRSEGGLPP